MIEKFATCIHVCIGSFTRYHIYIQA